MDDHRHGVFGVGPHLVAVHTRHLQEMFVLPEVRRPPGCAPGQRGVVRLRESVLPALDVRVRLGLTSAGDDLNALVRLLEDREQDHREWLDELQRSVEEARHFALPTDPRLCKFGRWYHTYTTDDAVLRGELRALEEPHAKIHALAAHVEELQRDGRQAEALRILAAARNGLLQELVALFARTRGAMRAQHREIGVCARVAGTTAVLVVDRAEAVAELEPIAEAEDPVASGVLRPELIGALARWKGSSRPVLVLDLDRLGAPA